MYIITLRGNNWNIPPPHWGRPGSSGHRYLGTVPRGRERGLGLTNTVLGERAAALGWRQVAGVAEYSPVGPRATSELQPILPDVVLAPPGGLHNAESRAPALAGLSTAAAAKTRPSFAWTSFSICNHLLQEACSNPQGPTRSFSWALGFPTHRDPVHHNVLAEF